MDTHDALVIVDVQKDFCPGGALPIAGGDEVVPVLNRWIERARSAGAAIVASRDWHPPRHLSFFSQGGPWPPHCIQHTAGAELHPALALPHTAHVVNKGVTPDQENYSAFDGTGLTAMLRRLQIQRLWIGGLALDVCVRATVLDACRAGFEVHLILPAARAVDPTAGEIALREMNSAGAILEDDAGPGEDPHDCTAPR